MATALKELFNIEFVKDLSAKLKEVYEDFDRSAFELYIFDDTWINLELKERMRRIAEAFNEHLNFAYEKQIEILISTKNKLSYEQAMALPSMVFQDFVQVYGLDDYENSIKALEQFTINSSSEFAIRYFIEKYEDKTMAQMKTWAKSSNEHLRRLASEGCRPRLPWAMALEKYKQNPKEVLEVLELLKNDKSKYVQKSVANNLNDISKDNKEFVIEFVRKNLNKNKNLDWICKHASRTLLKQGDKEILELFDYNKTNNVLIEDFKVDKTLQIGQDLNFEFNLNLKDNIANIRLEYEIEYQKANKKTSKKIFMISQGVMKKNIKRFKKKQSFKDMSTRKHYEGKHKVAIIINGEEKASQEFQVS